MRSKLLHFLVLLLMFGNISCKGYFTVVGSKLIKQNGKYHIHVTAKDFDEAQMLNISIRKTEKPDIYIYDLTKLIRLVNGETQKVEFDVSTSQRCIKLKDQPPRDYSLIVKSATGEHFEKSVKLNMNKKTHSVFIQTDKAIYKPADNVQFRVLVLNGETKPINDTKVDVFFTDGADNRVKQFIDVKLNKGVFQNELQLSDSPVLGNWKINVDAAGKQTTKVFEVAEYTLPKFEVTLDANPDAYFKDSKIRVTVRAKYTFGKIAKGNATVTAQVNPFYSWESVDLSSETSKSVEVNGKKPIEFDIAEELEVTRTDQERTVSLRASFIEELTGREQNATATVTIHVNRNKVELETSSKTFKPQLPFEITAVVRGHDGVPVNDQSNPVEFKIKFFYDSIRECERPYYAWNSYGERSPNSGRHNTYDCRQENSYQKTIEAPVSSGLSKIISDIPSNTSRIEITAKYLNAEKYKTVKKSSSESGQFIQIKLLNEKPKPSDFIEIQVLGTHQMTELTTQVSSSSEIIETKVFAVENAKSFTIKIKPEVKLVSKVNIVVFYITEGGEIISDSLPINYEKDLENKIELQTSKTIAKPGEDLEILISTSPNSFVGLLGVDQSVLVLKKGNDIELSSVFGDLESYGKADKFNHKWVSGYESIIYKDFDASEMFVITNAKKEFVPKSLPLFHQRRHGLSSGRGGGFGSRGGSRIAAAASSRTSTSSMSSFDTLSRGWPGRDDDMIATTQSNRVYDDEAMYDRPPKMSKVSKQQKPVEIRKIFPETWIFDSFDFDSRTSNKTITKKVPDSITSWIITGFSVNPETGLGLTQQPSKLNVFQPFFVSTNLPYSIKRGEVVSIPVIVFNYLEDDQPAEVTLFNAEEEFEFVDVKNDGNRTKRSIETERTKTVIVKSQSGVTVPFMIRPFKVGHITIKVVARTAVAGDGVERQLIVEPEGVTQYKNQAVFIDLRSTPEFNANINISIPSFAVPDSTKIEASAIGDILGPSIENLDKLIKLPYGCGEQNMLNFVPNIVALDYLTAVSKLTPEIESKAKKFMESGYQRELTYKHADGSYSAFGKSDKSGSTWLTAFVAKSFNQAAKYIMIDEQKVKEALDFLAKVQDENGSFPEVGHVSHKSMQGGSSGGVALTAYTLITFLENQKFVETYKHVIDKALINIANHLENLDNYSLAIVTYALQVADHSLKDFSLEKLEAKATIDGGKKYWSKDIPEKVKTSFGHQPKSVDVEMTAYALQAFIHAGREAESVPVMKWLVCERNENGGFTSTQDTVVGLQALAKLAAKMSSAGGNIDIKLKHGDQKTTSLTVNDQNSLILQKYELPPTERDFEVTATGHGVCILQVAYKYNINKAGNQPRFTLETTINDDSNKDFLHMTVCTSFVPDEETERSNMAVMEVTFPSGYTFDTDSEKDLAKTEKVKKIETRDGETVVMVYFDDIGSQQICPEFKAYRIHSVAKQKPAPIVIYDYYDSTRRARTFYDPPAVSLCDICNDAEECKADCEQEEINVL